MRKYTQFTYPQRYQISTLLKIDLLIIFIARTIGVHKSTVGREIVDQFIKLDWSPEQIRDHLGKEKRLTPFYDILSSKS